MTEDELVEITKKMEVLEKKFAYLEKGGSHAYHDSQHMTLSPAKLRDLFTKMSEIEDNPESEEALKFKEKVEQYEKENSPKVKAAPTIHRTASLGMMKDIKILNDQWELWMWLNYSQIIFGARGPKMVLNFGKKEYSKIYHL